MLLSYSHLLLTSAAAGAKPPGAGYGYGAAPPQGAGYPPYGMPPGGMVAPPGGMPPQGGYNHQQQQHMQRGGGRGPQHPPGGYPQHPQQRR